MSLYRRIFDTVLVRVDAETAHRAGFALLRAGAATGLTRRAGAPGRSPVRALGLELPGPLGLAAGLRQGRRRHRRAGRARLRLRRGRHRHRRAAARQPEAAPVPPARGPRAGQPDGLQQRRRRVVAAGCAAPRRAPGGPRRAPVVVGVNIGKTKVVPEDRGDRRLREERPAARAVRRLPGGQRQLAEHPRAARPAGRRQAASRCSRRSARSADAVTATGVPLLVKIAPDLGDDDVLAVADLALELGLDGIVATNTTISRDGLARDPARSTRSAPAACPGAPLRAARSRSPAAARPRRRRTWLIIASAASARADDACDRLAAGADPAPGLHRVHLRRARCGPTQAALAGGDRAARGGGCAGDPDQPRAGAGHGRGAVQSSGSAPTTT